MFDKYYNTKYFKDSDSKPAPEPWQQQCHCPSTRLPTNAGCERQRSTPPINTPSRVITVSISVMYTCIFVRLFATIASAASLTAASPCTLRLSETRATWRYFRADASGTLPFEDAMFNLARNHWKATFSPVEEFWDRMVFAAFYVATVLNEISCKVARALSMESFSFSI